MADRRGAGRPETDARFRAHARARKGGESERVGTFSRDGGPGAAEGESGGDR
ncbi:hypothetical protein GCM10009642_54380 [Nocardiopsis metallicus]